MKKSKRLSASASESALDDLTREFLNQRGVTEKKMFGTTALTIKGKVFAFPWKGDMVVKLPKERAAEIVASKKGIYFDPGHGRISKEWVAVHATDQTKWADLMRESRDFVLSK